MLDTITSIKNEKITLARAIKSRKGRQEHQRILLEGEEILDWAIENAICIEYIFISDKSSPGTADKYLSQKLKIYNVSEGILKKDRRHQLCHSGNWGGKNIVGWF